MKRLKTLLKKLFSHKRINKTISHPHPCPSEADLREGSHRLPSRERGLTPTPPLRGVDEGQGVRICILTHCRPGSLIVLGNQQGIALVITLLVLVLLTAMVVEFSYGVYTGTNNLYNWRDSQRLSLMAKSGINVSTSFLTSVLNSGTTKPTQSFIEMPVDNPFEDFQGSITVRIEDENAKFNVNTIVYSDGRKSTTYEAFVRLLGILNLSPEIAERIADWIDQNSEVRISASETGAKNADLASIDELLLIHGIMKEDYVKLLPYITISGKKDRNLEININTAGIPVLRCIAKNVSEEEARQIINNREIIPLSGAGDFQRLTGSLPDANITLIDKGKQFSIRSVASSGGVKRVIETVWNINGNTIEYWKEY